MILEAFIRNASWTGDMLHKVWFADVLYQEVLIPSRMKEIYNHSFMICSPDQRKHITWLESGILAAISLQPATPEVIFKVEFIEPIIQTTRTPTISLLLSMIKVIFYKCYEICKIDLTAAEKSCVYRDNKLLRRPFLSRRKEFWIIIIELTVFVHLLYLLLIRCEHDSFGYSGNVYCLGIMY